MHNLSSIRLLPVFTFLKYAVCMLRIVPGMQSVYGCILLQSLKDLFPLILSHEPTERLNLFLFLLTNASYLKKAYSPNTTCRK